MRYKNLQGMTFGKLKVIDYAFTKSGYAYWNCQCECGTIKAVSSGNLLRGASKTCGFCSKRVTNPIIFYEDYAEMIVKSKEQEFKVKLSLEDVEKVKKGRWWATKKGQNWYFYSDNVAGHKKISLHRYIMDCPKGFVVDHINTYDHLDNRRSNLRICTIKKNSENQRLNIKNQLGIPNVSWNKQNNKWRFYRKINGKYKTIQHEDLNKLLELKKEYLESVGIYENN